MENKGIVTKINKLLSLATSDNAQEAESAYKKAMDLMIKYNIKNLNEPKNFENSERSMTMETQEAKFVNQIMLKCFFVSIVKSRRYVEQSQSLVTVYKFFGEYTNLQIALYAFDFLSMEFKRLWKVYRKENNVSRKDRQVFFYGLQMGFVSQYKEREDFAKQKYGLQIIHDKSEINNFIRDFFGRDIGNCRPTVSNRKSNALMDAIALGQEISINKGLTEKSTKHGGLINDK